MKLPFNGRNRITQPWSSAHYGLDIVGDDDKRVHCVESGTVITSTIITNRNDRTWEWGNYVRVDGDDGKRYFYCHLASRAARAGQRINKGDIIGIMGNTGKSFGAHLHLQVRTRQNAELNVAEVLGVPNLRGTYTIENIKSGLYDFTVRVSLGDLRAFDALAQEKQVVPIIREV